MVTHLLAALLGLLLCAGAGGAAATRPLCLACHQPHYTERGGCTACHRGNPAADRKNIAHLNLVGKRHVLHTLGDTPELRAGERLLDRYACRRCHVTGGRGNRLSVNLDRSVTTKSPAIIADAILHPAQGMPDFRMDPRQVDSLITALLAASARSPGPAGDGRQVVHFNREGSEGKDVFSMKCGGCHRALTQRFGSLGSGNAGPNLSGLLSPFYPATFRERGQWTEERLRAWLKNPRSVRPTALMQPITLTEKEFRELVGILWVE